MIAHLSSAQLSECVLGQPSPIVAQHVQDCPVCRAELIQFREALSEFRGAVHAWSGDQADQYRANGALAIAASVPEPRPGSASHQLAWALLIAVVCVIASFVLPSHLRENAPASDAVLLNQVDAQVSRTAPSSMEPLMRLVVEKQ
jgi:anti-sigma factor RsiW